MLPLAPLAHGSCATISMNCDRFWPGMLVLYRHWKDVPGGGSQPQLELLLPQHIVPEVLQGLHSSPTDGHLGISKT